MDKKKTPFTRKRPLIQALSALLHNGHLTGFITGNIYTGPAKQVCVPGLNCYSCPGALGACPVGSLQNALSAYRFRFPYYVLGFLLLFGTLLGRVICGFLCPFGFLQELLYRVPLPEKCRRVRKLHTFPGDRPLRLVKYGVLALLVLLLPFMVKGTPFFCKYLCPSGTLSGLLLTVRDQRLAPLLGGIFTWKALVLTVIVLGSILWFRPFCKYLCPLGAFYALFNKVAAVRLGIDAQRCTKCGRCAKVCGMAVNPAAQPNAAECIRCGQCVAACPHEAIEWVHPTLSLPRGPAKQPPENSEKKDKK